VDVPRIVNRLGGIADVRALRTAGVPPGALSRSVAIGELVRVRRGWYATERAPLPVRRAAAAGGRLTCVSALRLHGVWVLDEGRTHVALPAHGRLYRDDVVAHWTDPAPVPGFPVDDVLTCLDRLVACASMPGLVAASDSVIERRLASEAEVLRVLTRSSRGRAAARWIDGGSQSGLESLARLALMRRGVRLRSQVKIAGVGRVDLLIGDRLVLELDGREWHGGDNYDEDRRRDLALLAAGYLVVRVSYRQVMERWGDVEAHLMQLIRRRAHVDRRSSPLAPDMAPGLQNLRR
jgi:very-short-patch-repair endonuclease